MTVASKTPIQHRQHKTATKKSSLKSTLTAAFSRHAATSNALDEYTRSIGNYLDHSDDVDLQGRSSREPSPEFHWRDLADIHLPNDALAGDQASSRHDSNASSFHRHENGHSSDDDPNSETSSLSSRISAMQIGGSGAVVAPSREQQAVAARQARIAQHQQQYNTNRVGGAGPAWHFYHEPVPKKSSSSISTVRQNKSSSSLSSSKKHCVK